MAEAGSIYSVNGLEIEKVCYNKYLTSLLELLPEKIKASLQIAESPKIKNPFKNMDLKTINNGEERHDKEFHNHQENDGDGGDEENDLNDDENGDDDGNDVDEENGYDENDKSFVSKLDDIEIVDYGCISSLAIRPALKRNCSVIFLVIASSCNVSKIEK